MTKYILAIDGGSQSTKVAIFDILGNEICSASEKLKPLITNTQGHVEHPQDDLWDSLCIASKKAFAKFKGDKNDIIGVGLCTIRCCRALLKQDGSLYSPVMSWMDIRVSKPYEHQDNNVKYVTTSSGYITHKLSGNFIDTISNYIGAWPIDIATWDKFSDTKQYDSFNIPKEMLFTLQMPGTIAGSITPLASKQTGIPQGLPVVITANDKAVENLGAGNINQNTLLVSLGTYITSMVQGANNYPSAQSFWTNFSCIPNQYLYESGGIRRGMWTVSWFKDLLGEDLINKAKALDISAEEYLNNQASSVPSGCDGLITILDWLAPTHQPFKKGMMIGFDNRHGIGHIYKSILEAIALTMKNHATAMIKELNITLDKIIISGGGSNSNVMMQIFADVFGHPVQRNIVNGSAALGSAICVAVATNEYAGFEEAVKNMVKTKDSFTPINKNTHLYDKYNDSVYKNVTNYTDELLKKSYEIFK